MMKEARKQRRRQRSGGGWSPQRFPRVWTGSGRRSRPTRRAHLGGRGRQALERGGERGGRPVARGAELRGGGGGGCPRPRGRGHGRGGGRGAARAGALLPSRLPADRGTAGTQRPDLSPGRVPGRRADAPRPRLLLGAYRALVPHAAAASPGCTTTTPLPRPPAPPRARLRGRSRGACARRAGGYLGLARPRPGLREPEEAEECMAGGAAGGRRRRRGPLRLRRGPRPSPAARRLGPQGPAAFAGAGGEGRRGGSGGSRDCGGAAPRAPSNEGAAAAARAPGLPRPQARTSLRTGRRKRAAQKGPGMSTSPYIARGALWSKSRESPLSVKTAVFHCYGSCSSDKLISTQTRKLSP